MQVVKQPKNLIAIMAAAIVLAVTIVLSFWRLALSQVWVDEATYVGAGNAYLSGNFAPNPEHPPLAKLIIGVWQLLFGEGVLSVRILMSVVTLLTGVAIWWFAARITGPRWAIAPAAMWLLMEHLLDSSNGLYRLERFVQLDTFMVLFLVFGFGLVWRWWQAPPQWWWGLLGGLAFGAAAMSKLSAVLFVPAVLAVFIARWHLGDLIRGMLAMLTGALAVSVAVLAPFGMWSALQKMLEFQAAHNVTGHSIVVDGQSFIFAPWWATFRFALDGIGIWGAIALGLGTIAAVCLVRPRRMVVMVLIGLTSALFFFAILSRVALVHYYIDWIWIPTLLTGLALPALLKRVRLMPVAGAVVLSVVVSIVSGAVLVLTLRPQGLVAAAEVLDEVGALHAPVLVQGVGAGLEIGAHIPTAVYDPSWPGLRAVVIGDDSRYISTEVANLRDRPPIGVRVHERDTFTVLTFDGVLQFRNGQFAPMR